MSDEFALFSVLNFFEIASLSVYFTEDTDKIFGYAVILDLDFGLVYLPLLGLTISSVTKETFLL